MLIQSKTARETIFLKSSAFSHKFATVDYIAYFKRGVRWIMICLFGILAVEGDAQDQKADAIVQLDLPKVFQIGEYEEQYGLLYETYHDILLTVCDDDMELAFGKWMHMIEEMEYYAHEIDFDLKGVKVWLKLFWNSDGTIRYLAYHLKPNSLNIDTAELSAFFVSFVNRYQMPVKTNLKFTHNGSAQFPTALIPESSRRNR